MNKKIIKRSFLFFFAVALTATVLMFWGSMFSSRSAEQRDEYDATMLNETSRSKIEPKKTISNKNNNIGSQLQDTFSSDEKSKEYSFQKIASFSEHESMQQETKGREIVAKLKSNFDGLTRGSYQIQWESLNDDEGQSSFSSDIQFKRPFNYYEKTTGGRVYTYFTEGSFEQYSYDSSASQFAGKSENPELDPVNGPGGFLERFPLRILQIKNAKCIGEEVLKNSNGDEITCDIVRNDYWQVYVDKETNRVIRADYYREQNKVDDIIMSLSDFEYSKVEVGENEATGEKKTMDFPISFEAVSPSTNYKWKCSIPNLLVNEQTSFDDSVFKFGPEWDLPPEL